MHYSTKTGFSKHAAQLKVLASIVSLSILAACGGGGGGSSGSSEPVATVLPPASSLQNLCSSPRAGTADRQGTIDQEKAYLRSFVDETYLWYKEVPSISPAAYSTAQSYFDVLKTTRMTASGRPVDEFHWSVTEAEYEQQSSGISEGYGIEWARATTTPPRNWVVANVEPLSPAGALFKRGDKLKTVDGVDFVEGGTSAMVKIINAALFPENLNTHTFEVIRDTQTVSITIKPELISTTPVRYTKVITQNGVKVGYVYFDDHIAKSEAMLITAFQSLKDQGAERLVLDLRYNGGGLLSISSKLAYMIGGSNTTDKVFNKLVYNDKRTRDNDPWPFLNVASSTAGGAALPTLNLNKVTILTSGGTASASEAIINGLRGVDVEVSLIGETTRGKPYGFVPQDNCGWVYYSVQFKGENNKGFGDFADGFAPTCPVKDDFTKNLGDVTEGQLAAALSHISTNQCPATTTSVAGMKSVGIGANYAVRPNPSKQLMIPR